jgi:glucose/arabinose dehydrogenase
MRLPYPIHPASLVAFACSAALACAANPKHGRVLFQQNCAVCHATGTDLLPAGGQGPLLAGIVGREAGSLNSFGYTPALKNSHLTWNEKTLDRFLTGPTTMVPGTNMVMTVPNARDRADVIAFLATLKPVVESSTVASNPQRSRGSGDWENDAPGTHHRIDLATLPEPFKTRSAGNGPRTIDQPANAVLSVPAGFVVKLFSADVSGPRLLRTAPNGDLFVAESNRGRIRVLRAADGAESPTENHVYIENLDVPFGLAFYPRDNPQWLYVGTRNAVLRFPYRNGDVTARAEPEVVIPQLAETSGGHTTRDVVFSPDEKRMFISVGSGSNVAEGMGTKTAAEARAWDQQEGLGACWGSEAHRADVLVTDPVGHGLHLYATGIRNAVGLAVQPGTGAIWVATNERDELGDDLVPDYVSHIEEGGYYGWPWYYFGNHEDPRHAGERPDLSGKAIVPDVPIQAHSASLQLAFYPPNQTGPSTFPAEYRGDIFVALHGSWNRAGRTGSKLVRIHLEHGKAVGDYEDFLTGFVVNDHEVWGRPVGVAVARDGALIVSDDAGNKLWRVSYVGSK